MGWEYLDGGNVDLKIVTPKELSINEYTLLRVIKAELLKLGYTLTPSSIVGQIFMIDRYNIDDIKLVYNNIKSRYTDYINKINLLCGGFDNYYYSEDGMSKEIAMAWFSRISKLKQVLKPCEILDYIYGNSGLHRDTSALEKGDEYLFELLKSKANEYIMGQSFGFIDNVNKIGIIVADNKGNVLSSINRILSKTRTLNLSKFAPDTSDSYYGFDFSRFTSAYTENLIISCKNLRQTKMFYSNFGFISGFLNVKYLDISGLNLTSLEKIEMGRTNSIAKYKRYLKLFVTPYGELMPLTHIKTIVINNEDRGTMFIKQLLKHKNEETQIKFVDL